MPQSRTASIVEQLCNVGSGMIVALLTWVYIIQPIFGIQKRFTENLSITGIFTIISLCRGFLWRRGFEWWANRKEK